MPMTLAVYVCMDKIKEKFVSSNFMLALTTKIIKQQKIFPIYIICISLVTYQNLVSKCPMVEMSIIPWCLISNRLLFRSKKLLRRDQRAKPCGLPSRIEIWWWWWWGGGVANVDCYRKGGGAVRLKFQLLYITNTKLVFGHSL